MRDRWELVGVVSMDLSKAFDLIQHDLLLAKLKAYSVGEKGCALLKDYLTGRQQRVRIGDTYSRWQSIGRALEQRSSYFEKWKNEVAERLPGKKTASMGKYGTPTTKTTENTRISSEGKRSIEGLLREHGLESRLNEFQFTSVTTLRTEGMFGVYNRDQRKDDRSLIKESSRVKKEASEMRDFCRVYGKGVKVSGVRQIYKQRPGSLRLYCRKPKATVTLHDQESAPLLQWLDSVTQQNGGKRAERAKGKEPGVSTEQSSEASEENVMVVGPRVTKDGVEYLVKGTQEPDRAGMWIPERMSISLLKRQKQDGRGLLVAQYSQRNTSGFFYSYTLAQLIPHYRK
ncbi:hypothetical protein AWC38_SpisGene21182 [Stylophora pistillata]|uniref:Reverse transcriptase domain-containing protein n=1 Tax=Stylophora pistillata TaxID=50429 RepID=A0A2B4R8H6_STYPI|nr:hypothetical protein AWC38_SpisGene21182 [Stylophora pistillata]